MEVVPHHEPVMLAECVEYLQPRPGNTLVDGTLGLGGHAQELLRRVGPEGCVVGLDRDPEALRRADERLREACAQWGWARCPVRTAHADFRNLGETLREIDAGDVQGFLFDLGVSSMQLDLPERGFSFRGEGPLDMRMDPGGAVTAADLVNTLPEAELARLLWELGDERYSRRIARRVVEQRKATRLTTTSELADLVWRAYPAAGRKGRIHPATRTFQALRIAVNDELAALEPALMFAGEHLETGGRIVVLSYQSLEDRIVKRTFEFLSGRCRCPPEAPVCTCGTAPMCRVLTRKPVGPSDAEVAANPRARSARLRAVERLGGT